MPFALPRFLLHAMLACGLCLGLIATGNAKPFDHEYANWQTLLKKHVHWLPGNVQSRVDYAAIKQEHTQLKHVLLELSTVPEAEFAQWTPDQQTAFLINAYNAFTIELVLSQYPDLKSIKELGSVFSSPWRKEFFRLLGDQRSLDWVEHSNLRPNAHDPRIHFAIVCASIGCPALRNEAFTASKLDLQLEDSIRRFMSDKSRNRVLNGKLEVSPIFKWFASDFEKGKRGFRGPLDVFARYATQLSDDAGVQQSLRNMTLSPGYTDYDWNLNDTATR